MWWLVFIDIYLSFTQTNLGQVMNKMTELHCSLTTGGGGGDTQTHTTSSLQNIFHAMCDSHLYVVVIMKLMVASATATLSCTACMSSGVGRRMCSHRTAYSAAPCPWTVLFISACAALSACPRFPDHDSSRRSSPVFLASCICLGAENKTRRGN